MSLRSFLTFFFYMILSEPLIAASLSPILSRYELLSDRSRGQFVMKSLDGTLLIDQDGDSVESVAQAGIYDLSYFSPMRWGHLGVGATHYGLRVETERSSLISDVQIRSYSLIKREVSSLFVYNRFDLLAGLHLGVRGEIFWVKREIESLALSSEARFTEMSYDLLVNVSPDLSIALTWQQGSRIEESYLVLYHYESLQFEMEYQYGVYSLGFEFDQRKASKFDSNSHDSQIYKLVGGFPWNPLRLALLVEHRPSYYLSESQASLENVEKNRLEFMADLPEGDAGVLSASIGQEFYSFRSQDLSIEYHPMSLQIGFLYQFL